MREIELLAFKESNEALAAAIFQLIEAFRLLVEYLPEPLRPLLPYEPECP
jgi:hypothetical protein